MTLPVEEYRFELQRELNDILNYWTRYAPDPVYGGFYGRIDNNNQVYPKAPRGSVLYSRILWTFSAAFNCFQDPGHLVIADKAYDYLHSHFLDTEYGGVYWTVDFKGQKLDERKQIYAQAFFLYALSEYYKAVKRQPVLELAIQVFRWIELKAFDYKRKGYYEAFGRDWSKIEDQRLSPKDQNEQKTMNTHLHLLEAYSNLYGSWKNAGLRSQIENLLEVFAHHFIDDRSRHLHLFFDEDWNQKSELISYGHEIEAAWLLQQAAETVRHPGWTMTMKSLAIKIADAATEGLDPEGGMNYESENNMVIRDKHWWPQAEAMVGFYNAYQVSGEERWLKKSIASWQFVKNHIKDNSNGEWFWGVDEKNMVLQGHDKIGLWKCPYHNGRACIELISRIAPQTIMKR
ncbi:MAG: AGE family epimerase/isomerase [Chitinophagales bacterium]